MPHFVLCFIYISSDTLNALAPPQAPIYSISTLIHAVAPALRVLLLLPLLVGLMSPCITHGPTTSYNDIEQPTATDSSFLLPPHSGVQLSTGLSVVSGPAEENSKYGTFRTAHTDLQPSVSATRVATPVPSTSTDLRVWRNDIIAFFPLIPGLFLISSLMLTFPLNPRGQRFGRASVDSSLICGLKAALICNSSQ